VTRLGDSKKIEWFCQD